MESVRVFLGLGSNIGERLRYLERAVHELSESPCCRVSSVSSVYETEPVDFENQADFLNAVLGIRWEKSAVELLIEIQRIEKLHGRERDVLRGPRTLDIDMLIFGDILIDVPGLKVPHPRLEFRKFVLVPLAEICPDVLVPGTGKMVMQLLRECSDTHNVRTFAPATSIWQNSN